MKDIRREVGARIRAARQALKMTQAEVAERAGIDSSFYGQIERGANVPSLKTLFAIAETLRVEPADLLPRTRGDGKGRRDPAAGALDSLLTRLKPSKRRFLMSVVRDLADELR